MRQSLVYFPHENETGNPIRTHIAKPRNSLHLFKVITLRTRHDHGTMLADEGLAEEVDPSGD